MEQHTAIECCQDPGLLWVEIDRFDTLTARKELALWRRNRISISTFDGPDLSVKYEECPALDELRQSQSSFVACVITNYNCAGSPNPKVLCPYRCMYPP
jgi:hypothetical protein